MMSAWSRPVCWGQSRRLGVDVLHAVDESMIMNACCGHYSGCRVLCRSSTEDDKEGAHDRPDGGVFEFGRTFSRDRSCLRLPPCSCF